MAIVKCKPTSPGRRHVVKVVNPELHKGKPFAPLVEKTANLAAVTTMVVSLPVISVVVTSRLTVLLTSNATKMVSQRPLNVLSTIRTALRTSHWFCTKTVKRRYILAPKGLKAGDQIQSGVDAAIKAGNTLPMRNIPVGSTVHNVEMKPGKGGQIARSAGTYVQIVAREGSYVTLRLRSGEMRKVESDCRATLGEVGNAEHMLRVLGKAGAARWRGVRPTVRGTAMNPVDHPHGGGEGRNFGKHPVSPWGLQTKGKKTRSNKRTDKFIVRRRSK